MNEDFVPFELAVKLKEKGFTKETAHYYNDKGEICVSLVGEEYPYPCSTISQVLKWLREDKKIHIEVMFIGPTPNRVKYYITNIGGDRSFMDVADEHYETWEQATLAGIEYVLYNLI